MAPILIIVALNYYLSSLESVPSLDIVNFDKIVHTIFYIGVGVCLILFVIGINKQDSNLKYKLLVIVIFGSILGVIDEYHQSFVPGRSCDILDWVADTSGILISFIFINKIKKIVNRYYLK